jgi:uncharacterized caspase-like protein
MNSEDSRSLRPPDTTEAPFKKGRQVIVVIGISDYENLPKLQNAVNDAKSIRDCFVEQLGFVAPFPPLLDGHATKAAINSLVIDQLADWLQPDDSVLIFFAGHGDTRLQEIGEQQIETGYIVPVEAKPDQWSDYIEMGPFLNAAARVPARHVLVVLDACHSGFGLGKAMAIFRDRPRYEQDLAGRVSRKVITSARRDQLTNRGGRR